MSVDLPSKIWSVNRRSSCHCRRFGGSFRKVGHFTRIFSFKIKTSVRRCACGCLLTGRGFLSGKADRWHGGAFVPCSGAYLTDLPQLELHSDRFAGTFTPFRIKSTPFRNGRLNSLFVSFILTHFPRKCTNNFTAYCSDLRFLFLYWFSARVGPSSCAMVSRRS